VQRHLQPKSCAGKKSRPKAEQYENSPRQRETSDIGVEPQHVILRWENQPSSRCALDQTTCRAWSQPQHVLLRDAIGVADGARRYILDERKPYMYLTGGKRSPSDWCDRRRFDPYFLSSRRVASVLSHYGKS